MTNPTSRDDGNRELRHRRRSTQRVSVSALLVAALCACDRDPALPAPGPDTLVLELGGNAPVLREVLAEAAARRGQPDDARVAELGRDDLTLAPITRAPRYAKLADGETLSQLAARTLGSAQRWREIAELNGIENPNTIAPGERLLLPPE